MVNRSSSTQASKEEKLDYPELMKRLAELGIDVPISRADYSRAGTGVKVLIKILLDRLEGLEVGESGPGLELTDEEIEYIIYRLRTVYGDPRATSVVAKLFDVLKRRRGD